MDIPSSNGRSGRVTEPPSSSQHRQGDLRKSEGFVLYCRQFWALFVKRAISAKRDRLAVVMQLLVPILLVLLALRAGQASSSLVQEPSLLISRWVVLCCALLCCCAVLRPCCALLRCVVLYCHMLRCFLLRFAAALCLDMHAVLCCAVPCCCGMLCCCGMPCCELCCCTLLLRWAFVRLSVLSWTGLCTDLGSGTNPVMASLIPEVSNTLNQLV